MLENENSVSICSFGAGVRCRIHETCLDRWMLHNLLTNEAYENLKPIPQCMGHKERERKIHSIELDELKSAANVEFKLAASKTAS